MRTSLPFHEAHCSSVYKAMDEKGSIIPSVEALDTRTGRVEKDNADGYLEREVWCASTLQDDAHTGGG